MKEQLQGKNNIIRKLKEKISYMNERRSEADRILDFKALDSQNLELTEHVTALQEQNDRFWAENEKTQLKGKMECVTMNIMKPKVLAPGMYAIDVEPILPHNRNSKEVHLDYLKHLKESVETLREIIQEARIEKPLDNALKNACFYTKRSQEFIISVRHVRGEEKEWSFDYLEVHSLATTAHFGLVMIQVERYVDVFLSAGAPGAANDAPAADEGSHCSSTDYSKPSHEGYKNTIELPIGNNVVPLRSNTIRLVQNGCLFHGLRFEDLNQHLKDFLILVDSLDLDGDNRERMRLRLFQCSLRDQASNWLERLPAGSITTWEDLTTRFLAQFFPPRRTSKLRNAILMFQQHHGESLSEAWTRLRDLLQKVPHHGIDLWLQI
ncbi:zinc finger, CCHC-type containing protein [Tanacetum coccineum]